MIRPLMWLLGALASGCGNPTDQSDLWVAHSEFKQGSRWCVLIQQASNAGTSQTFEGSHVVGTGNGGSSLMILQGDSLHVIGPDGQKKATIALTKDMRGLRAATTSEDGALLYAILQDWSIAVKDLKNGPPRILLSSSDLRKRAARGLVVSMLTTIRVSQDGQSLVIGLPSDTVTDQGSSAEPMMETFQVSLLDATVERVGWGTPCGWLSDGTLVSEGHDVRVRGVQDRVWLEKGDSVKVLTGFYTVAVVDGTLYGCTRGDSSWDWYRYESPFERQDLRTLVGRTDKGVEAIFGQGK